MIGSILSHAPSNADQGPLISVQCSLLFCTPVYSLAQCSLHSVQSRMAVGYNADGSVAPLYDLGWLGPAGQMVSTTDDLNKVW